MKLKNIFIFHPAGIGDAVLDLSTLNQLCNASNFNGNIHYIGNIIAKPIIELSGLSEDIKKHYIRYPLDFYSIIKLLYLRNKIDCLAILGGMNLKKVSYLKYLLKPKIMIGALTDDPLECITKISTKSKIYNHIEGPIEGAHRTQLNLLLLQKIGINTNLSIKGLDKTLVDEIPFFNKENINTKGYFTIHMGNEEKFKTMPPELWIKVLKDIIKKYDNQVIILGGKNEKPFSLKILESIYSKKVLNFTGKTNLYQTIRLINSSKAMISIDSGLSHIASALEVPLVSIYGPTKISQISPINIRGYTISYPLECSNCYWSNRYYDCQYGRECLSSITPNSINKAIKMVINNSNVKKINNKGCIIQKMITNNDLKISLKNY